SASISSLPSRITGSMRVKRGSSACACPPAPRGSSRNASSSAQHKREIIDIGNPAAPIAILGDSCLLGKQGVEKAIVLGLRCCANRNRQQLARRLQALSIGMAAREGLGLPGPFGREYRAGHV